MSDETCTVDILKTAGRAENLADSGVVYGSAVFEGYINGKGAGELALLKSEGGAEPGDVEARIFS